MRRTVDREGTSPTSVTLKSANAKLKSRRGNRNVATTSRPRISCPTTCPFLNGGGCYAAGRIDAHAARTGIYGTSWAADIIDHAPTGTLLRHFVVGDLLAPNGRLDPTVVLGSKMIAAARPDIDQFGYTHSWQRRDVSPDLMPGTVLNASCETAEEVRAARAAGWDTVVTVVSPEAVEEMAQECGSPVVLCPAQRLPDVGCGDCGLCAKGGRQVTVAFAAHGSGRKSATAMLELKNADGTVILPAAA